MVTVVVRFLMLICLMARDKARSELNQLCVESNAKIQWDDRLNVFGSSKMHVILWFVLRYASAEKCLFSLFAIHFFHISYVLSSWIILKCSQDICHLSFILLLLSNQWIIHSVLLTVCKKAVWRSSKSAFYNLPILEGIQLVTHAVAPHFVFLDIYK